MNGEVSIKEENIDTIKKHLDSVNIKPVEQLADEHWDYTKRLLSHFSFSEFTDEEIVELIGFFYRESGKHFYKHCEEDIIKARGM